MYQGIVALIVVGLAWASDSPPGFGGLLLDVRCLPRKRLLAVDGDRNFTGAIHECRKMNAELLRVDSKFNSVCLDRLYRELETLPDRRSKLINGLWISLTASSNGSPSWVWEATEKPLSEAMAHPRWRGFGPEPVYPNHAIALDYNGFWTASEQTVLRGFICEQQLKKPLRAEIKDRVVDNETQCEEPFGELLGYAHEVPAYSNCHSGIVSSEFNVLSDDTFTGMKWQCVEYARRFLIQTRGLTFESVSIAADIWDLTKVSSVHPTTAQVDHVLVQHGGWQQYPPSPGSLVIYPIQKDLPYGHVAVIVDVRVDYGKILIAEQNWDSYGWGPKNFTRVLKLVRNEDNFVKIIDDEAEVFGWMTPLEGFDPVDRHEELVKDESDL